MKKAWKKLKQIRALPPVTVYFVILILFTIVCNASSLSDRVNAADGEDITISANTTWNAGTYTYRDITVTNNSTLTLNGTYTTDTDGTGVIINARTITINSGSTISANGKGYAAGAGTGKGTGSFGSGAGYGGTGAVGETGTAGGGVYGSAVKPLDLGSGGGNSGGAGGGAINLNLSGNLVLGGTISANGNNGGMWKGSGSGGSIYVNAVDMSGSGTISANGGTYSAAQGGGGRVALYYTGAYSLDPTKILANSGGGGATNGSVFVLDKTNKDLVVFKSITLTPMTGVDAAGNPTTDGIFNFRNLTVNNSSTLTVSSKYTTDTDGSGITFNLTGNLTVDAGSKIDAKGQGYQKGAGEGKGIANGNVYGGGGAHGGNGGRGEIGAAGVKYDSTLFPVKLGSGGATTRGAAGGGIIKVTADQIVVNGSLDASASAPTADGSTNGSGAAGGTVFLKCSTLSGTGLVAANASNGTGWSGGGGGGRIAIYGDASTFNADNITATKGLRGGTGNSADGGTGTVFLYNTVSGNVTASSDVTFEATQGVNRDGTARTDGVFYFNNLIVSNNAIVTVGSTYTNDTDGRGVTINLDGNLTVESGSKITSSGQGYAAGYGPGKGTGTTITSGSGGSYGGVGGKSYNNNLAPAAYGITQANFPYSLGSSGGNGYDGHGVGGKGGGAITLRVLGSATNNGEISSDGVIGTGSYSSWVPGGGSGGSVFINCDSLSGSGNIWAKGGDGLGDLNFGSGGGSGGRISIVYSGSQTLPLANFSAAGGVGGGSSERDGAEGSVNITQRILPAAEFTLKNPNNNSTEFTNTENVEIIPADGAVQKYKEAASVSELVPTFYADGWANVSDGKDVGATEGSKTFKAWFKDGNELISSSVGSAAITLDTTNPTAEITNNNQITSDATTTVNLTLDDNLSGIDYVTINGQQIAVTDLQRVSSVTKPSSIKAYADSVTYQATVDLVIGANEFPVAVYDKAGNFTTSTFVATRTQAAVTSTPAPDTTQNSTSSSTGSLTSTTGSSSSASTDGSSSTDPQGLDKNSSGSDSVAISDNQSTETNELNSSLQPEQEDATEESRSKVWWWALAIPVAVALALIFRKKAITRV